MKKAVLVFVVFSLVGCGKKAVELEQGSEVTSKETQETAEVNTTDWKTYYNEVVGIEIKYSEELWEVKDLSPQKKISFLRKDSKCLEKGSVDEQMNCLVENTISIEKSTKKFYEFKTNLEKDDTVTVSHEEINLEEEYSYEKITVKGKDVHRGISLEYVFISRGNDELIVQGKKFDKTQLKMISMLRLIG